MSLQGSIETFQLPDVLVLLASTKKTGELSVKGDRIEGRVWVKDGQLVKTDVARAPETVDAIWELLRLKAGTFNFDSDTRPPGGEGKAEPIEPVLADAQARLAEWLDIEKVIPSTSAWITLAPEAPSPEVSITADQWKLFVGIGDGRSVETLMDRLNKGEFDTCKWLKELADAGMLEVSAQAPAGAAAAAAAAAASAKAAAAAKEQAPAAKAEPKDEKKADAKSDDADGGPEALLTAEDALLRPAKKDDKPKVKIPASANATSTDERPSGAEADALVAQLAALNGGDEEEAAAAIAAAKAKGEEVPVVEDGEQINRGLLLKFLSSVRS